MMLNSSLYCDRSPGGSFYKNSNSDYLLLHNQIVLYWNVSAAYNFTATPKTHRAFGRVVCPGVSVRPAGRYVRHYLTDGAVYFWLLHVRASIDCPSRHPPRSDDFKLRLTQWIDRSEAENSHTEFEEAYEGGDSFFFLGHKKPENLTLSCSSPQRSVTLQGRLCLLVVSWDIFPSRFSSQSDNETLTSTNQLLDGFKTLPADLKIRVQITSRLHFDGKLSQSRRRQLCEFYGFWCNGNLTEDASLRRRQHRRSDSGDEVTGMCIRPSMRCDGLPDCWLDDPLNSPDEVGCNAIHPPDSAGALSPFETFNESFPVASSPPGRGQSWTAKLPWMGTIPSEDQLQERFQFDPVGSNFIRLTWNEEDFSDMLDGNITVKAALKSEPTRALSESAYLIEEEVILVGLTPNSSYTVTVTGTHRGKKIFEFTEYIQTSEFGHEGGILVTSRGSGIIPLISVVPFSFMAFYLA